MKLNSIFNATTGALLTGMLVCAATAGAADEGEKGPSYLMMTEGIVGGFVPAHVRQQTLIISQDGKHQVLVMKQPARNQEKTFHAGELTAEQFARMSALLAERGLYKLPLESPAGCQDIYKLDTSIAARLDGKFWRNGGPGGCVHGQSKVQPSEEELAKFKKLTEWVHLVVEKYAADEGDAETFTAALAAVQKDAASDSGKTSKLPGGGSPVK